MPEAPAQDRPFTPPGVIVPDAAIPGPNFDVDKATEAYIALLTPEQRKLLADRMKEMRAKMGQRQPV